MRIYALFILGSEQCRAYTRINITCIVYINKYSHIFGKKAQKHNVTLEKISFGNRIIMFNTN